MYDLIPEKPEANHDNNLIIIPILYCGFKSFKKKIAHLLMLRVQWAYRHPSLGNFIPFYGLIINKHKLRNLPPSASFSKIGT